jgi:hypothetical protein
MKSSHSQHKALSLAGTLAVAIGFSAIAASPASAQSAAPATKAPTKPWVMPRTPEGKPDFQGNWTNETQTPFERMGSQGQNLTEAQAAALEKRAKDVEEFRDRPTDPNETATSKNGTNELASVPGEPTFVERIAQAAGGNVGGYNGFWLDPGHSVIRIDGVPRSSIVIDPPNGRLPAITDQARQRVAARSAGQPRRGGGLDGPEAASLSDRCLSSFGSNAGPPMLPNYFYNNNYTIVQTKDHVMIFTEMVHDARIVRMGAKEHAPSQVRRWYGDSIGRWEGDTLVVETTNLYPTQLASSSMAPFRASSDKLKITERFTQKGPNVMHYKFTVEDPDTIAVPYSGELPFYRINENIFEYACHEGNYALPAMLGGARMDEKAKAEAAKK